MRRFLPLLLVPTLLSSCSGGGSTSTKIHLGAVGRSDVSEVVEAPATVTARATATLRSPAEGTVRTLYVSDGDTVRKGEVLARIDSPTAREQLQQARQANSGGSGSVPAGVNLSAFSRQSDRTAKNGFDAAKKVAAKIPDLKQRAWVLTEITKAQAEYATAAAAAQSAVSRLNAGLGSVTAAMASIASAQRVQTQAAVRSAERVVQGLTIKAPFSGVVSLGGPAGGLTGLSGLAGQLPAQLQGQAAQAGLGGLPTGGGGAKDAASVAEGAPVASGDAVVTVTDVSRLTLSADVDETDVLQVKRGVEAAVEFDAVQGGTYTAQVTGIGVTPKESNGGGVTYKVTLSLERGTNADGSRAPWPKPGMSAVAHLRVRDVPAALSVPSSAIVTSGRDSTVWVLAGGKAERRVVRLGAQGDAMVQIVSGLKDGDRVVIRGADGVKQGQELPER
ncbi:MAG: efflux transporter, family, subunit [Actinomycetia bacterium]|nr:efflux transporter, family, subunit [Actinomycetes bacterium]